MEESHSLRNSHFHLHLPWSHIPASPAYLEADNQFETNTLDTNLLIPQFALIFHRRRPVMELPEVADVAEVV